VTTVRAIVQKVVPEGDHGPFAVAEAEGLEGSTTFSLEPTVWQEEEWPEEGMIVVLGKLRKKRAGWRAKTGRFLQPSDEQVQHREQSSQAGSTFCQVPHLADVTQQADRFMSLKEEDVPRISIPNWHGTFEVKLGQKHFFLPSMERGSFQLGRYACELTFGLKFAGDMFFRVKNLFPASLVDRAFNTLLDNSDLLFGAAAYSPDRTFYSADLDLWSRFRFFYLLSQLQQEVLPQLIHAVEPMKIGASAFAETLARVRKVCASFETKG